MTFATANAGAVGGSLISMVVWLAVMFGAMYVLILRPQKKERVKTEQMLSSLEVGDAVVTTSGFYGIIIDITEEDVIVEFGNNKNCRIPMRKAAISAVEKPEYASDEK